MTGWPHCLSLNIANTVAWLCGFDLPSLDQWENHQSLEHSCGLDLVVYVVYETCPQFHTVITTAGTVMAVVLLLGILLGYTRLLLLIWNGCTRNICSAVTNWPLHSQCLPGQNIANDQLIDPQKTAIPPCQIRNPDNEFCAVHLPKCRLSVTKWKLAWIRDAKIKERTLFLM